MSDDEKFVDSEYLERYRNKKLDDGTPEYAGPHLTVPVATHGQFSRIDAEIAELIYSMWACGIITTISCQDLWHGDPDMPKSVFIGFEDIKDAELFMALVVPEDEVGGSMWDRATGCNYDPESDGMWEWGIMPKVYGRRTTWQLNVAIPATDVPLLVEKLGR